MKTRLKDMVIEEGTICARGKNSLAKVVLFKMDNTDKKGVQNNLNGNSFLQTIKGNINKFWQNITKQAMTMDEMMHAKEARGNWWDLCNAFEQSCMSIMQDETADQSAMLMESCMQFINRAKPLAPYMGDMYKAQGAFAALEAISEDVSKAGKKISAANMEKLKSAMQALKELMGMPMMEDTEDEEDMEMMDHKKKPKSDIKDMPMKKSDYDYKNNQKEGVDQLMDFNEIIKSLSPEQQKSIQDEIAKQAQEAINKSKPNDEIKKQLDEVNKANVELAKALEAERDLRITKEFIAKAENYKSLPVKAEDFGKMLKDICKKAPEQYEELVKVLDAANNLIEKNNKLMDEIGGGQPVENDALVKMNTKAAEIQKAHSGMTFEVAFAKACNEDPLLYNEYLHQIQR